MHGHVLQEHGDALHGLVAQRPLARRQLERVRDLVRQIAHRDRLSAFGLVFDLVISLVLLGLVGQTV